MKAHELAFSVARAWLNGVERSHLRVGNDTEKTLVYRIEQVLLGKHSQEYLIDDMSNWTGSILIGGIRLSDRIALAHMIEVGKQILKDQTDD